MLTYPIPAFEQKIFNMNMLSIRLAQLPRPLVFTNGCFDILHRGHVTYLAQAKSLGASLIVGVNSDASVKRLGKGEGRPINTEHNRMAVLAALESTDSVIVFDEDTPLQLILTIKPDILVKGGDWLPDTIVGSKEVLAAGGRVYSIPFLFDTSTTATINRIKIQS
jgi:rfaE bifunctional protein nucleotidyltransferase chain/domain